MNYKVLNMQGKEVGTVDLDPAVFGGEVNETLVHDTVVWQLAKRRSGSHSALTKAEVSGGGKKPWKQKGTGRARAGSNTSPIWVGGGVSHGPKPRSYESRLPKRTRRAALISVLSDKVKNNDLMIVEDLSVQGKTKEMAQVIKSLGLQDAKGVALVLPDAASEKFGSVARASKNLKGVLSLGVEGLNVYDLLKHKVLLTTKAGVEAIQARVK